MQSKNERSINILDMYIGRVALEELLNEDSECINWLSVDSINDRKSKVELSNGEHFTINASVNELFNMIKESKHYALPPIDDIVYRFFAINQEKLENVTDEYIVFDNDMECENIYENTSVLLDTYQLSFNYVLH